MIDSFESMTIDDPDSREKLIHVAGRMFAEKGFDGVTTRQIAGAAKVNISLISYYFGGKKGLYLAVIEDFVKKAQELMHGNMARVDVEGLSKQSYVAEMRKIMSAMVGIRLAVPYMPVLLHREMLAGFPHAKPIFEQVFASLAEKMIGFMETAQKKKILRKDLHIPTLFASMVFAIDGYYLFGRCDTKLKKRAINLSEQLEEFVDQIVRIFVEGALL